MSWLVRNIFGLPSRHLHSRPVDSAHRPQPGGISRSKHRPRRGPRSNARLILSNRCQILSNPVKSCLIPLGPLCQIPPTPSKRQSCAPLRALGQIVKSARAADVASGPSVKSRAAHDPSLPVCRHVSRPARHRSHPRLSLKPNQTSRARAIHTRIQWHIQLPLGPRARAEAVRRRSQSSQHAVMRIRQRRV
jgi:hypothetical protein